MNQLDIFDYLDEENNLFKEITKDDWIDYVNKNYNEWHFKLLAEIITSSIEHYQYVKLRLSKELIIKTIFDDIKTVYNTHTYHQSIPHKNIYTSSYKRLQEYTDGTKKHNYSVWIQKGSYCLILLDRENPFDKLRLNAMGFIIYDTVNSKRINGDERFDILNKHFKVFEYATNSSIYNNDICYFDITLEDLTNYFKEDKNEM